MRDLHVVAVSEDGRHVVLATRRNARTGQFRVAVDERLAGALRGEAPSPEVPAPAPVSPREIQARLRAGESVDQIARSAGVPLDRVERYAGPVLAERERVVAGGRVAFVQRPRLGPSSLPLGEAVERNLADNPAYQPDSARWSARREDSGGWVVELSWSARGRRRTSGWRYDLRTGELSPVDPSSAALGHVPADAAGGEGPRSPQRSAESRPSRRTAASRTPAARTPAAARTAAARTPAAGTPAARPPAALAHAAVPAARRRPAAAEATGPAAAASAARTSAERAAQPGAVGRSATAKTAAAARLPAVASGPSSRPGGTTTSARTPVRPQVAVPAAAAAARPVAAAPPAAAPPAAAGSRASGARSRTAATSPAPPRRRASAVRQTPRVPVTDAAPAVRDVPSAPPTLRVVPPAPDVADEAPARGVPAPASAPVRRAVGERVAPDWADVLFGAAPPAAQPTDRVSD